MNFDEVKQRAEEFKAKYDKETRRAVRAFWIPVGLIVGGLAGFALAALTL